LGTHLQDRGLSLAQIFIERSRFGYRNGLDKSAFRVTRCEYRNSVLARASLLDKQIRTIAAKARIDLRDGEDTGISKTPLGLTDREFEVLRLVAAGLSNREIANNLLISSKTASVHVSNILSKLSVPSRGAAAAMAHRLRIVGPD
jgi:DNA-binding NarL/FixJ family response regulator